MIIAIALITCITLRLKLVGLLGSFFLKKYIYKFNKKRRLSGTPESLLNYNFTKLLFLFEFNTTVQYTTIFG
jgi:hypothetical protein